jgi:hypothetical protein
MFVVPFIILKKDGVEGALVTYVVSGVGLVLSVSFE